MIFFIIVKITLFICIFDILLQKKKKLNNQTKSKKKIL
jgi:hypothetical protein